MTLRDLVASGEKSSNRPLTKSRFDVRLTDSDAAKVAALAEMYPSRTKEQIITELLSAALNELEYSLPYIEGNKVSELDECGDPIYEDIGPTPKFTELTKKHLEQSAQH